MDNYRTTFAHLCGIGTANVWVKQYTENNIGANRRLLSTDRDGVQRNSFHKDIEQQVKSWTMQRFQQKAKEGSKGYPYINKVVTISTTILGLPTLKAQSCAEDVKKAMKNTDLQTYMEIAVGSDDIKIFMLQPPTLHRTATPNYEPFTGFDTAHNGWYLKGMLRDN